MRNWWRQAFERGTYPLIEATRRPEWRRRTKAEVGFLVRALDMKPGTKVLDVACGTGRHAIEFGRRGYPATGFDFSPRYLGEARHQARRAGADVRWVRGDMRRLPFESEYDVALNLFSSFGYFPSTADDAVVLRGVRRALRPGGRFVLELVNGAFVRERLETCRRRGWPLTHWGQIADGMLTLENPRLVRGGDAVVTDWIFLARGGSRRMTSFFRLYSRSSLAALLRKSGLTVERVLGGFDGAPFDSRRSRRMLVVARRPRGFREP